MELGQIIECGLSLIGLIGGFVAYVIATEIKTQILSNNEKVNRNITQLNDSLIEMKAAMPAQILTIVNGKYVRSDLFQQFVGANAERFESVKDLIDANRNSIEQRQ